MEARGREQGSPRPGGALPRRPEDTVGMPAPDLSLPSSQGGLFSLRSGVDRGPLVLFFYIRNGTPGWIRELREFRAHHDEFRARGVTVAGVTRDSAESNALWSGRLALPYPLLSDPEGEAGRSFGVVRTIGLGAWSVEFFRRSTFLIGARGEVAAVWRQVPARGHARDVLAMADALLRAGG